jgi:hypothetical protein
MTAPRTYFHSSAGRPKRGLAKARHVEDQPCPATLGAECHVLRNTAAGVTRCRWCGETWAALDAELRGVA